MGRIENMFQLFSTVPCYFIRYGQVLQCFPKSLLRTVKYLKHSLLLIIIKLVISEVIFISEY